MSIKNFGPQKNSRFLQGTFDQYKPNKYFGPKPIIYRSSWELKFMRLCEYNPNVLQWSSESIVIPYTLRELSKKTGNFIEKRHNYHPDFVVITKDVKYLIEIKPLAQSPQNENQIKRDPVQYKNARKWKAALEWCKLNGYKFKVINELHLKTRIF